jgi:hypothetical protein
MKLVIAIGLLWGVIASQPVAEAPKIERPHWVIVATIVDLGTGAPLGQSLVGGSGVKFDDLGQCESVLDGVQPVLTDRFAVVLSCERVGPRELAV